MGWVFGGLSKSIQDVDWIDLVQVLCRQPKFFHNYIKAFTTFWSCLSSYPLSSFFPLNRTRTHCMGMAVKLLTGAWVSHQWLYCGKHWFPHSQHPWTAVIYLRRMRQWILPPSRMFSDPGLYRLCSARYVCWELRSFMAFLKHWDVISWSTFFPIFYLLLSFHVLFLSSFGGVTLWKQWLTLALYNHIFLIPVSCSKTPGNYKIYDSFLKCCISKLLYNRIIIFGGMNFII